jgi:hypothetical protein
MDLGVRVEYTLNGMVFDGNAKDLISKATRDAVLAFMVAQGEVDYQDRAEMRRRVVAIAKAEGIYGARARSHDYAAIKAWRAETGRNYPGDSRTIRCRYSYGETGVRRVNGVRCRSD